MIIRGLSIKGYYKDINLHPFLHILLFDYTSASFQCMLFHNYCTSWKDKNAKILCTNYHSYSTNY